MIYQNELESGSINEHWCMVCLPASFLLPHISLFSVRTRLGHFAPNGATVCPRAALSHPKSLWSDPVAFFPWWSREANYPTFCSDFSSYLKKKNNLSNSFSNSSPLLLSFSLITEDSSVKCTEALYFWMLERLWLFTACAGLFVFSVCYAGPWTFDLALNDKEAWTVSLYIRQVKQGL